jgi:hypothetical protein
MSAENGQLLVLTSAGAESGESHDFVTRFTPPLKLPENARVCLLQASVPNTWSNVTSNLGNSFRYHNGTTWRSMITLSAGQYSVVGIEAALHQAMRSNGDYSAGPPESFSITMAGSEADGLVYITISNSYKLELTTLGTLLGFANMTELNTDGVHAGTRADFNRGISSFLINSDLVDQQSSSVGGKGSSAMHQYLFSVSPSSNEIVTPAHLVWQRARGGGQFLDRIRVFITSQTGSLVSLGDEPVTVSLYIK